MDIKKLITGFLILAGAASSSALILSSLGGSSTIAATAPQLAAVDASAGSALGGNAFLPAVPGQLFDQQFVAPMAQATSSDPNNLTDAFADNFLNGVVSANPSGPQNDPTTGQPVIASPDTQAVAMAIASSTAMNSFKVPDWALEADAQAIKTSADASPEGVSSYSKSLVDIVNRRFVATNLTNIVNAPNPDPSQANYVQSQIQGALGDALTLTTPAPLAGLQKSLVRMLVYEKNAIGVIDVASADPVKASLILQDEKNNYNAATQNLQEEMQKAATLQGFSFGTEQNGKSSGVVAALNTILGIQTAHAQWLTFDSANFASWIESFVNNVILQILKNTLIALLQKHVLSWVQGNNGIPRFIQGWGTTLVNAYEQTALNTIDSQMICEPTFYAPQMRATLNAFYTPPNGGSNVCANVFQASLGGNTLAQFQNNFQNGGWVAFGGNMLPSGNYYGSLFFNSQTIGLTSNNAQQAAQSKAVANQGQKGDEACADGSTPGGTHPSCSVGTNIGGTCYSGNGGVGDVPLGPAQVSPNNGLCANGAEPTVTTPGVYTGFGVNSGLDSSSKLVTAANDIAGLLNALTSSLLNSLANVAISAANNAVNGNGGGGGGGAGAGGGAAAGGGGIISVATSTIQGGGVNNIPPVALACNPPTETVSSTLPASFGAVGGTSDTSGNPPLYTWTASDGTTGSGYLFSPTFAIPGNYTVTINDSTGDPAGTCHITVQ